MHTAFEQDKTVQAALTDATRDHRKARLLRTASGAGVVLTLLWMLLLLLLGAALGSASTIVMAFALLTLATLVATVVTFARANGMRARTTLDLERAQTAALVKLLAEFPQGALASQLASSLQISHSRAEQLLTRLNVRDDIQSMVADDGQLLFRIRGTDEATSDPFAPPAGKRLRLPAENVASPEIAPDRSLTSVPDDTTEGQQPTEETTSTKEAR